jgi:hypothetical protein
MKAMGPSINVQFDSTEDKSQFTDSVLGRYDALLFLMNTGEGQRCHFVLVSMHYDAGAVLDGNGKAALQNYLNSGGNFIAIHAASDALRNTTFYGEEVGKRGRVWSCQMFLFIDCLRCILRLPPGNTKCGRHRFSWHYPIIQLSY